MYNHMKNNCHSCHEQKLFRTSGCPLQWFPSRLTSTGPDCDHQRLDSWGIFFCNLCHCQVLFFVGESSDVRFYVDYIWLNKSAKGSRFYIDRQYDDCDILRLVLWIQFKTSDLQSCVRMGAGASIKDACDSFLHLYI